MRVSYQAMIGASGSPVVAQQHAGLADARDRDAADRRRVGHLGHHPAQDRDRGPPQLLGVELGAVRAEDARRRRLGRGGDLRAVGREDDGADLARAGVDAAQQGRRGGAHAARRPPPTGARCPSSMALLPAGEDRRAAPGREGSPRLSAARRPLDPVDEGERAVDVVVEQEVEAALRAAGGRPAPGSRAGGPRPSAGPAPGSPSAGRRPRGRRPRPGGGPRRSRSASTSRRRIGPNRRR